MNPAELAAKKPLPVEAQSGGGRKALSPVGFISAIR
jgi:hypothetical protein